MNKKLFKSKTFWGGITGLCTGIGMVATGDQTTGIQLIFTSIMGIFLRDGVSKIK